MLPRSQRLRTGLWLLVFLMGQSTCKPGERAKGTPDAPPETEQKMTEPAVKHAPNRLAGEVSPYLLQHANNPVDWYPWGEEAFARAKAADKPVFLSIGYATCHWCHVMAHESFADPEVAALMNEAFVSIKVDREERPDIDNIYMSVCQLMTGGGGWPLTIIMTPDKQPFFSATYIPKTARFGRRGMLELVPAVQEIWKTKRANILQTAREITDAVAQIGQSRSGDAPGEAALALAFRQLKTSFDAKHGGFGRGMKFPTPHQLNFLLRYHARTQNPAALDMVETTLTAMRHGGIYDHVGKGFHRYSTDSEWRVPHFEKMLYDQAQLLDAYVETYQVTQNEFYRGTAREIAEYVLRDMTSPEGGFYSAEDADSEGVEGKFYVWTDEEIEAALDEATAALFKDAFDVRTNGNYDSDEMPEGGNVLVQHPSLTAVAARHGLTLEEATQRIESAKAALYDIRKKRVPPLKDDKILTDWNGLMMGALAKAGRVLGDGALIAAAAKSARFIKTHLTHDAGRLLHRYRDGKAGLPAHLDDYAFIVSGLIEIYEATFDPTHLEEALRLNALMLDHFADPKGGALFLSADDTEKVLVRAKELYDGALPSGNSRAVLNLLRLSRITGDTDLETRAEAISAAYAEAANKQPITHTMFLCGLDFALGPSVEIVISGNKGGNDTAGMLNALDRRFIPNKVVLLRDEENADALGRLAPFVANQPMQDNQATAYVCVNHACSFPTTDPEKMMALIEEKRSRPL